MVFHSLGNLFYQSSSSKKKISSTDFPNTCAIFKAKTVEGTYRPDSMAFIDCRLTPILLANSSCVRSISARATFKRFFIAHLLF